MINLKLLRTHIRKKYRILFYFYKKIVYKHYNSKFIIENPTTSYSTFSFLAYLVSSTRNIGHVSTFLLF